MKQISVIVIFGAGLDSDSGACSGVVLDEGVGLILFCCFVSSAIFF